MKTNFKLFLSKMALALACVCLFTAGIFTLNLNGETESAYAATGSAIASGSFSTTDDAWNGAKTKNLILPPPILPSYNTGDGKDTSSWKSFWTKTMVKSGWGSNYISGDDSALQVFATTALNGSSTFAIRPVKSGTFGGGDACLGGSSEAPTRYDGGISYTIQLSSTDMERANNGQLRTSAKAEFYRQVYYRYYIAVTVEFLDADGVQLSVSSKKWSELGNNDGYLSRGISAQDVPAGTAYIRYWFCDSGKGNSRKAIKNMQAYLINDAEHTEHDGIEFEAWSATNSLPTSAGNYFLTADVTLTSAWTPVDSVNLCLNGYKIIGDANDATVRVGSDATLTVYDCSEAGEITHADGKTGVGVEVSGTFNFYGGKIAKNGSLTAAQRGSGVLILSGTFNMYGGEISENKLGKARGAGVSVGNTTTDKANATFNMYGGEIHSNTVSQARGSAVSIGGATTNGKYLFYFNMYGGEIHSNTSSETNLTENVGDADAVVVDKNGRFVMSGGEITSNRNGVYVAAGVATLSGTAKITGNGSALDTEKGGTHGYNLRLAVADSESRYLTVGAGGFAEGAKIGVSVTSEHDNQISSANHYVNNPDHSNADSLNYIYSEDGNKKLYYDSTLKALLIDVGHSHDGISFEKLTSVSGKVTSNNYYLAQDMTATNDITIPEGATVTLCLNGHTLNMGKYKLVNNGALTICNCQASGFQSMGNIVGSKTTVENNGKLSLDGGKVESTGNSAIVNNSEGSLNIESGEITSSAASGIVNNGGNVEASEGVAVEGSKGEEIPPHTHDFSLENNCVCGAHSHDGGTTLLTELTATSGDLVSGNYYLAQDLTATNNITIPEDATVTLCLNGNTLDLGTYFIKNKGTLTVCDCAETQGEIISTSSIATLNNYGALTVSGGTVSNSTEKSACIFNTNNGTVEISGNAKITNIGIKAYGIQSNSGAVTVSGGTVYSENYYGISGKDSLTVSGGEIESASECGIYNLGTLTVTGGKVSGTYGIMNNPSCILQVSGTAEIIGTTTYGIYNHGTLTMTGGSVSGVSGINNYSNCTAEISGTAEIVGTSSSGIVNSGALTITGGSVSSAGNKGINNYGALTITGGSVSSANNIGIYNDYSGDVYGTATVSGGSVSGTIGIFNDSNCTVEISGTAEIVGTSSYGVQNFGGALTMTGGSVSGYKCAITVDSQGTSVITGGTLTSTNTYALNVNGTLYLLGEPTIVSANDSADIIYQKGSIYAVSDGDTPVAYNGRNLTIEVKDTTSTVIVNNVTEENKDKFSVVNENYSLILGTDENSDDLILHKHSYTANHDQTDHWDECTCGDKQNVTAHAIVNGDNDCTTDEKCSCGFVMVAKNESHTYAYVAERGVITETCSVEGCTVHTATATISAPIGTLTYDGNEFKATVAYSNGWKGGNLTISYSRNGDIVSAGEITASITVDDETASVSYTVAKAKVTKPTADSRVFTYTGNEQIYEVATNSLYTVEGTARTDAGSQNVTVSLIDKTNYEWTDATTADLVFTFAIDKANAVITVDTANIVTTYGETFALPTATTNFGTVVCDKTVGDLVNANTYVVTYSVEGTSNYNGDSKTVNVTINKATYDMSGITFKNGVFTYDGQAHSIAITGTLPTGVSVQYSSNNSQTNATASPVTVTATFSGDNVNYNTIPDKTATITVNKATYDMSSIAFENGVFTYDGQAHDIAITGTLPTGVSVQYSSNNSQTNATASPVTVTATFTGDSDNYNAIPDKTATITVNKAKVTKPTADSRVFTYTGNEQIYEVATNSLYTVEGTARTDAGSQNITISLNDTANYEWTDGTTTAVVYTFSIAKANANIIVNTTAIVKTYGETFALPTATTNFGTVVCDKTVGDLVNANTYVVTYSVEGTSNYNGDSKTVNVTINKATYDMSGIAFENGVFTYDGQAHSIAITGTLPTGVSVQYSSNNSQTNATASPVTVTATFTGDSVNYNAIPDKTATITVNKATYDMSNIAFENGVFTYDGQAHSIAITGTLPTGVSVQYSNNNSQTNATASPVTVTATFSGDSVNYNAIPDKTATITVNKAKVTKPTADSRVFTYTGNEQIYEVATNSLYTVEGAARTDAGSQDVTISLNDTANYEWTDGTTTAVVYTFSIAKANAVITVVTADIVTTYGETFALPTATTNFGTVVCDKTVGDLVNANTYVVTYSVEGTSNYNGDSKTVNVTINKATYDMSYITFTDKTVKADGAAHSLVINGTLPTGVSVSYTNNGKTDIGVYTVTATFSGDSDNYNAIEPMTATLTINKAEIVDSIGETQTPSVIVTSESGFAPNVEIVITEIAIENAQTGDALKDNESVVAIYDISLKLDGVSVQPDGKITIKLLIPDYLLDKEFRLIHSHSGEFSEIEYEIKDDYAVFSVNNLSEFMFIYDSTIDLGWLLGLLSGAAVILVGLTALCVVLSKKNG